MLLRKINRQNSYENKPILQNLVNVFCLCPDCPSCKRANETSTQFCDFDASTMIVAEIGCLCASCIHEEKERRTHLYHCKTGHNHGRHRIFS